MNRIFQTDSYKTAAKDYLLFLDKGYPQKSILKLVGDRHRLNRQQRQIMYRGISPSAIASERKRKRGVYASGDLILVDTYNVLFTVSNYFLGRPLFISNDGFLRDAGEMRGRIRNKEAFSRAERLMIDILKTWKDVEFRLFLDEPVPFSGRLSIKLSKIMAEEDILGEASTAYSADYMLKSEKSTAICTSDSAIIDAYPGKIIDLSFIILDTFFQPEFPEL